MRRFFVFFKFNDYDYKQRHLGGPRNTPGQRAENQNLLGKSGRLTPTQKSHSGNHHTSHIGNTCILTGNPHTTHTGNTYITYRQLSYIS